MKNQKEAVYSTVTKVLAENKVQFEEGHDVVGSMIDKDMRSTIVSILCAGFEAGEIELKSEQENLKSYTNSLLSNWLRKDKRFNGGVKYEAKNPGSRTGNSDPTVKNLRLLIQRFPEGSEQYNAIDAKIEARVNELKAEKARSIVKEIDANAIPDDLKHLLD